MKLIEIRGRHNPNSSNAKQDNWWQNDKRSHYQKQDANGLNELNCAVPKVNKYVHGRKYVTRYVTTQHLCAKRATFKPLVLGATTKRVPWFSDLNLLHESTIFKGIN